MDPIKGNSHLFLSLGDISLAQNPFCLSQFGSVIVFLLFHFESKDSITYKYLKDRDSSLLIFVSLMSHGVPNTEEDLRKYFLNKYL